MDFVLDVKVFENLSLSLPVEAILDSEKKDLLLRSDPGSMSLLAPGQACTLVAANGSGLEHYGKGVIRSISPNGKGFIVNIT